MITSVIILYFLEGETEAQKGETIYLRHEAGEVIETCPANREKHGPEQQRKLPQANHSPSSPARSGLSETSLPEAEAPPAPCPTG